MCHYTMKLFGSGSCQTLSACYLAKTILGYAKKVKSDLMVKIGDEDK